MKFNVYKVAVASVRKSHYSKNGYEVLPLHENGDAYNDIVFMTSEDFKKIFGSRRSDSNQFLRRLAVVKIKPQGGGHPIYRRYYCMNKVGEGFIGLSINSIVMMSKTGISEFKKDAQTNVVVLSKGCKFLYYWQHPDHGVRASMKLGFWSVVLAVWSVLLAILSPFFAQM